jgi:hypothetical protein
MNSTIILCAGGTLMHEPNSVARVTLWHIPNGTDYNRAVVLSCYFSDQVKAQQFAAKYKNPPELADVTMLVSVPGPKVFSFRAEFPHDIDDFQALLVSLNIPATWKIVPLYLHAGDQYPAESSAELGVVMTLQELRDTMKRQPDSHVMIQTLREIPLAQNNLERDYSIN